MLGRGADMSSMIIARSVVYSCTSMANGPVIKAKAVSMMTNTYIFPHNLTRQSLPGYTSCGLQICGCM